MFPQTPVFEPSHQLLLLCSLPSFHLSITCLPHFSLSSFTAHTHRTLSTNFIHSITQLNFATMPKRAKFAMRISKKSVFLQAQHADTPGRNQRQSLPQLAGMAAESDLHTAQSPAVQQTQQDEDWIDEEENVPLWSDSAEADEITNVDPSPNASESDPPETRDNASNQIRAKVRKASYDHTIANNNALVVADAAVRQAMWMLRDAHNVRDNIIRHRIAFLQRREEVRKDFDLLSASVMESFAKDPHDRTCGRTAAQWASTRDHHKDMASKASNVHE
jgi:hypothetical protein